MDNGIQRFFAWLWFAMLIHPGCGGEEFCGCLGDSGGDVADEGCGVGLDGPIL